MTKVLFVCLGNICRSPTAEGVFRKMVADAGLSHVIQTDSAGTGSWHVGSPPDRRAAAEAKRRGIDISDLRGRQARRADFERFDYILAMDRTNYEDLRDICPPGKEDRLHMFLDFAPGHKERDVPDPYYGGGDGFRRVYDLVEAAAAGLLAEIRPREV
ncbi:low molecular weight protein-tyrosine-phosphatase [Magnetospira sp. QH-2]|uniref:low molecular weight protein-tyrosine-phosphatase n=1 Tax=Magnetospira sp. (strain QH-2) TaxID=1288970 RepID=UPI0003E81B1A|nr:low molecular weight protein-tyrosine-phosphatase [Magnetospira sp. QH-2]CCQ72077.1 Protein-tyrosine-phosphatase [Magnetospira sp. QH-2]